MKPQTMSMEEFFSLVCFELGLNENESDEGTVIQAIVDLNEQLRIESEVAKINYAEWQKAIRDSKQ